MAYKAYLKISTTAADLGMGREDQFATRMFTLVECDYEFHREVNENGLPKDGVTGGRIYATIVTPANNLFIYKWLYEGGCENGWVEFQNADQPTHYIMFERARCVNIYEYFNNQSKNMMTTQLTIHCPEIGFYGANGEDSFAYSFRHQRLIPKIDGDRYARRKGSEFKDQLDIMRK